jgi:hypothetical protein
MHQLTYPIGIHHEDTKITKKCIWKSFQVNLHIPVLARIFCSVNREDLLKSQFMEKPTSMTRQARPKD